MELLNEIRSSFAALRGNRAVPVLSLGDQFPAWIVRYEGSYGVGIPLHKEIKISERFANARLWSEVMAVGKVDVPLLLLTSDDESLRYEFASVCAQFVDPGRDGSDRAKIVDNPVGWWERWKNLLGNSVQEKAVYSVLGEMLAYEILLTSGQAPIWAALRHSTQDIETVGGSYEVKSTISRYGTTVTINSQFQLQNNGKELNLIFCRFEEAENGVSISDMVERLVGLGIDRDKLNEGLSAMGLEEGRSARLEKYKVLEMRNYKIDESFPLIHAESFIGRKIPKAIIQITYKVELAGLNYTNWLTD